MAFTKVTKEEFFKAIGNLDVHPRVEESTLKNEMHVSIWENRQRMVVGKTSSSSWGRDQLNEYFLAA